MECQMILRPEAFRIGLKIGGKLRLARFWDGRIFREELHLLPHAAADDDVVAVKASRAALAVEHFVANIVINEALQFLLCPAGAATYGRNRPPDWLRAPKKQRSLSAFQLSCCRQGEKGQTEPRPARGTEAAALSAARTSRRVPDRRRVGALGRRHRGFLRHCDAEIFRVIGGPARRRYFDHAHIVERAQSRIEVGVLPDRDHLARANRVGPRRVRNIYGVAN